MRVARICSRPEDRNKRLEELGQMLLSRGYNKRMVAGCIAAAKSLDRTSLLQKVVRGEQENRMKYITTFDPRLPGIPAILTQNWQIMVDRDPRLLKAYPKPTQTCYKRPPNPANHLIRARLPKPVMVATRAATGGREVGVRSCGKGEGDKDVDFVHIWAKPLT